MFAFKYNKDTSGRQAFLREVHRLVHNNYLFPIIYFCAQSTLGVTTSHYDKGSYIQSQVHYCAAKRLKQLRKGTVNTVSLRSLNLTRLNCFTNTIWIQNAHCLILQLIMLLGSIPKALYTVQFAFNSNCNKQYLHDSMELPLSYFHSMSATAFILPYHGNIRL